MAVFTPPQSISQRSPYRKSIFLAGSIEMGVAEHWQTKEQEYYGEKYNVFNPRRADWNSDWKQGIEEPQFYQQVNWELNALDKADYIIMYFDPNTKSPISLLELGLYATSGKLLVCCPDGFWRKGNVDIVCNKYDIKQFDSLLRIRAFILNSNVR